MHKQQYCSNYEDVFLYWFTWLFFLINKGWFFKLTVCVCKWVISAWAYADVWHKRQYLACLVVLLQLHPCRFGQGITVLVTVHTVYTTLYTRRVAALTLCTLYSSQTSGLPQTSFSWFTWKSCCVYMDSGNHTDRWFQFMERYISVPSMYCGIHKDKDFFWSFRLIFRALKGCSKCLEYLLAKTFK